LRVQGKRKTKADLESGERLSERIVKHVKRNKEDATNRCKWRKMIKDFR